MTQKEREKREAITVPQTYNNQLKKAIDEKTEKGRVSFYRAAPLLMPHPPLYLVTPYKGVDIDKRERRHRTPKQNRQTMKINEILSPSIRQVLKATK